jgi:3-hydroxyacyl-[acyl-carrier-protein] dehydratase
MDKKPIIGIERILELLPHRYPMLLVDRVVEIKENNEIIALKNVTFNEPFFQGHFPGDPIMPGVLIIEALAQAAGLFVLNSIGKNAEGHKVYFLSIDKARFRKPVVPGDTLMLHAKMERCRGQIWRFATHARVDGQVVAEAICTAMIVKSES